MTRNDARTRRDGSDPGPMPTPVQQGRSLWRLAVLVYLPVLVVSILRPILGWEGMVADSLDAARKAADVAGPDVPAFTPAQVESTLLYSTLFSVGLQLAVTALTWWLASRLERRSSPARMALAVLSVAFAVNAVLDLVGIGGADALGAAAILLSAAAAILAVVAAVLTFRDATPRGPWFESAD
ncbi:hypothetical protein [Corynebacterium sp. 335C]